jgi:hypothetical protein
VEVGLGNWGFTTGEKGDLTTIKTKKKLVMMFNQ